MKKYLLIFASLVALSLSSCGNESSENETSGEKLDAAIENTENAANDLKADAENAAQDIKEGAENMAQDIKEGAQEIKEDVKKTANDAKKEIKGATPYAD